MRFFGTTLFFAWLILLPFFPASAQNGSELTVDESVRRGLDHNYRLRAVLAEAGEAHAIHRQARANRLPAIQSRASYTRLSDNVPEVDFTIPGLDTTFTVLPVELNRYHSEISIEQPLFTGFRLHNQIRAAAHQAEAAELIAEQERADVALEVRRAYWNLYRALAAVDAVGSALEQVETHLRDVGARVEEGTALRTDLLSARTRRSEVLLEQVEARSTVRVARLELNRLIGLPADEEVVLVAPEEPAGFGFDMDDLVTHALGQRPALHALTEQVRAHEADVRATQAGWLPEVGLVGRYIYARPNQYFFAEQDQFRGTWEMGVALRWNIWAGGQRFTETSRARARLHSAEARLTDMQEQVLVEVARQYLELERAADAISVAAAGVEAAEEAFRSARMQFEEGVALSVHVLDAEYAYRMADARHVQAIADYEIAMAAVLNALGQVW